MQRSLPALIRPVTSGFPRSATIKHESGLPFSVVVQPLAVPPAGAPFLALDEASLPKVPRCYSCYGYLNSFCRFSDGAGRHGGSSDDDEGTTRPEEYDPESNQTSQFVGDDIFTLQRRGFPTWTCSLCNQDNELTETWEQARYFSPSTRQRCIELNNACFEFSAQGVGGNDEADETDEQVNSRTAYVAIVSLAALQISQTYQEGIIDALNAVLEALPYGVLFGLVAVSANELHVFDFGYDDDYDHSDSDSSTDQDQHDQHDHQQVEQQQQQQQAPPVAVHRVLVSSIWHHPETISAVSHDDAALMLNDLFASGTMLTALTSESRRSRITQTLESLRSLSSRFPVFSERGFTTALSAVLDSLIIETYASAKLACFISPPILIDDHDNENENDDYDENDENEEEWKTHNPLYDELMHTAISNGVSIDLFYLRNTSAARSPSLPEHVASLCPTTGGSLVVYNYEDDLYLPQDVYRGLSSTVGYRTLLRLRTSPSVRIAEVYGPQDRDGTLDDLFVSPSCNTATCFTVDLGFVDGDSGCFPSQQRACTVQLAFAYTYIDEKQQRLRKYSRIYTAQFPLLDRVTELYDATQSPVLLGAVVAKLVAETKKNSGGVAAAKMLAGDWFARLVACYNLARFPDAGEPSRRLDLGFGQHLVQLGMFPRFFYSLMLHPLFNDTDADDKRMANSSSRRRRRRQRRIRRRMMIGGGDSVERKMRRSRESDRNGMSVVGLGGGGERGERGEGGEEDEEIDEDTDQSVFFRTLVHSGLSPSCISLVIYPMLREYNTAETDVVRTTCRLSVSDLRQDYCYLYDSYTHIFVLRPTSAVGLLSPSDPLHDSLLQSQAQQQQQQPTVTIFDPTQHNNNNNSVSSSSSSSSSSGLAAPLPVAHTPNFLRLPNAPAPSEKSPAAFHLQLPPTGDDESNYEEPSPRIIESPRSPGPLRKNATSTSTSTSTAEGSQPPQVESSSSSSSASSSSLALSSVSSEPSTPPLRSMIDSYMAESRQSRYPTPQIRSFNVGAPASSTFFGALFEDAPSPDPAQQQPGFQTFLRAVYQHAKYALAPSKYPQPAPISLAPAPTRNGRRSQEQSSTFSLSRLLSREKPAETLGLPH